MIIEEKIAGDKVCHKLFTPGGGRGCIGSMCMAWRWAVEDNPDYKHEVMVYPTDPRANPMFIRSKTHGYCGIAGQA